MMKHLSIEYNQCTVCGKTYFNLLAYKRHIEKHLKASDESDKLASCSQKTRGAKRESADNEACDSN